MFVAHVTFLKDLCSRNVFNIFICDVFFCTSQFAKKMLSKEISSRMFLREKLIIFINHLTARIFTSFGLGSYIKKWRFGGKSVTQRTIDGDPPR